MMGKTAMEEFIEKLDSYKIPKEIFVKLILADIRKMAQDLLEKEKTQIIEASQNEDYYNITYGRK